MKSSNNAVKSKPPGYLTLGRALCLLAVASAIAETYQCIVRYGAVQYNYCGRPGPNPPPKCIKFVYYELNGAPSFIESCVPAAAYLRCDPAEGVPGIIETWESGCDANKQCTTFVKTGSNQGTLARKTGNMCP
jgi:hypothetical protein